MSDMCNVSGVLETNTPSLWYSLHSRPSFKKFEDFPGAVESRILPYVE
jgi:hypothetical protein